MKRISLALVFAVCASPLLADAGNHIIPAGSLIGCTLSEPRISSKTTAVGDPILCRVGYAERYGRSVLPYNSYLVGRFEAYKDPGHFVGKGWMELKFDRMVIEPDQVVPVDARVVDVPGYKVDEQGRILGKGHVVRDAVLWSIPVLWPVDLIMLPVRGPRPVLKEETRLTLKVMDDMEIPATGAEPQADPYGLMHRPEAENEPGPNPYGDQQQPQQQAYAAPQGPPQDYDQQPPYPPQQDYAQPTYAQPGYGYPAPPMAAVYPPPIMLAPPVSVYAYGGAYGGVAGGYSAYGYRGYAAAPRGYAVAPRGYAAPLGYAAAPRGYASPRGYTAAPRGYAYAAPRGGGYAAARVGGYARGTR
jgi:hypothetical protein